LDEKTFHYLSNSLFDVMDEINLDNNTGEQTLNDSRERNEINKYDENYGLQRFGATFVHYLSKNQGLRVDLIFIQIPKK
jgi:hypothetical protein